MVVSLTPRGGASPPAPLLKAPRVIAVRGLRNAFQVLDYEVGCMPGVQGVHARKLAQLCGFENFSELCDLSGPALPARAPRWTPEARRRGVVTCGGMLARGGGSALPVLARVCAARDTRLTILTPPLPAWLRDEPSGHLGAAIATGVVDLVEHDSVADYHAARGRAAAAEDVFFVPQGCAWPEAEPGVAALARSIGEWRLTRPGGGLEVPARAPRASRALDVVLPAGSGTTALFLARHAPAGVRVYAVPCKGDAETLLERMRLLDARSGGVGVFPRVLPPPPSHTVKFGTIAQPLLASWRDATERGVLLDLSYGPVAYAALEACRWRPSSGADDDGAPERDVLLINSGGHEGLPSQMRRYLRAGHLRKWQEDRWRGAWVTGQWDVDDVISEAKRVAMVTAGLVHTRDAGL